MNFFDPVLQMPVSATRFGLCDNGSGNRAFVDIQNPPTWIAIVTNQAATQLLFVAVDKGVVQNNEPSWRGRGRCDGMLFTADSSHIVFVELKEQEPPWIQDAIAQLGDTVELFIREHPNRLGTFQKKRAYACNKKRPDFKYSHADQMKHFRNTYGVSLRIQQEIVV